MDKLKISNLEALLKFRGAPDPNVIVSDASILTCGCLVSELYYLSHLASASEANGSECPDCQAKDVSILTEITPLRDLFNIIQEINIHLNSKTKRRSSSKKSIRSSAIDHNESLKATESMDLISLFYKYANEENSKTEEKTKNESVEDISAIKVLGNPDNPQNSSSIQNYSTPPNTNMQIPESLPILPIAPNINDPLSYEHKLLTNLGEEKEYNFSKCFPFHRKLSIFQTQQSKFNISSITRGAIIKKNTSFVCSDINSYIDFEANCEITRFVLITNKKWELYEYKVHINIPDTQSTKPTFLCCGKLTGEFGKDFNNLQDGNNPNEIVIRNDFASSHSNSNNSNNPSNIEDRTKRLNNWDQVFCKLSRNYLVIGGTKGIMRVLNVSPLSLPNEMGKPIYMYITNFPIRCISISQNELLVACGITAKERLSSKEQPFIILHKLNPSLSHEPKFESVDPITITIPYRDPIKLITFNASSTHLLCCTVWESRYLIIKLRSTRSDNYRKPRLVWTDLAYTRHHRTRGTDNSSGSDNDDTDDFHLMDDEGITDLQFGTLSSNAIFLSSCSLKNRPSYVIKLDGEIDSKNRNSAFIGHGTSTDNQSQALSILSSVHSKAEEEENDSSISNISGAETIMKIPEIGSSIHRITLLPRGDGIVFLDKAGHIFLVSTPNLQLHLTSSIKKVVVQLGEVANAARYVEAASIKFSEDGGKLYAVDRKGVFQVYDFTKGIPGHDSDVVKCRIIKV